MTPAGQRHFRTAALAKAAAIDAKAVSWAVIKHPRQPEFAWVAPVEFFMTRSFAAINAGIQVVEMGP
jgi:hypothetical protein